VPVQFFFFLLNFQLFFSCSFLQSIHVSSGVHNLILRLVPSINIFHFHCLSWRRKRQFPSDSIKTQQFCTGRNWVRNDGSYCVSHGFHLCRRFEINPRKRRRTEQWNSSNWKLYHVFGIKIRSKFSSFKSKSKEISNKKYKIVQHLLKATSSLPSWNHITPQAIFPSLVT
jgi:hypothetical protein